MRDFKEIRKAAREHHKHVVKGFHTTHKQARKLLKTYGFDLNDLRHHAVRTASLAGIAASALVGPAYAHSLQPTSYGLVSTPLTQQTSQVLQNKPPLVAPLRVLSVTGPDSALASNVGLFTADVNRIAPNPATVLPAEQEKAVTNLISSTYGITVTAELDGIRNNANYGLVGAEQHLLRYPGDTTAGQDYPESGMAPKPGAYGYFAPSKQQLTANEINQEKWYGVVQTPYAPGWAQNVEKYYNWFNGRKMLFVNPDTGQAVVVDIKDSGPSQFLDRKFGASPEAIDALGYGGSRKGRIFAFFVDDPTNSIPLGPVGGTQ